MNRPPYRHDELTKTLAPRSIAIVGVSQNPSSFGARTISRLSRFKGEVYRVNPRYDEIDGERCYRSLADLPQVPDCVVVATGRDQVLDIVRECAAAGVGGCIVYASGFADMGDEEGIVQQNELARIARESGMRVVGPNCIGLANFVIGANITFHNETWIADPAPHSIGIVSQSGALGNALIQSIERGVQVSHMLASGNSCDVDVADYVSYLAADPNCRAIACLFEGLNDPKRMINAARVTWEADKPLIIYKIAESEQGATAAMSHTGSLAGSHAAYRAALERYGVVFVDNLEALMETAAFFAKAGEAKAAGCAVIATSGGATVIAADKAEAHGVPLPQPGQAAQIILEENVPEFGSARNPCDVTAQVVNNPASFSECLKAVFNDPAFGSVVVPNPYASDVTLPRIATLGEAAGQAGKIGCWVSFTDWLEGPGLIEAERNANVALFRSFDRCFRTLASWRWRTALRDFPAPEPAQPVAADLREKARAVLAASQHCTLTEREAKAALKIYGVPVVEERLSRNEAEAVAAALNQYPVVIKVESPAIPHKTEAGVIALGITCEAELKTAYTKVMDNALKAAAADKINGVLVQPMIPAGVELMIGVRNDPQFGPLLVVGMGGIMVELLRDTALLPAPVAREEAHRMLRSLKGFPLLSGFRGSEPVDLEMLVDIICRISQFACDQASTVSEIDVNPLICSGNRITAVDALIVKSTPT